MAQHTPIAGHTPSAISREPAMAGTHMSGFNAMGSHVDSAMGDIGYKPQTHSKYQPQAGRADKHASNVITDSYLAANR